MQIKWSKIESQDDEAAAAAAFHQQFICVEHVEKLISFKSISIILIMIHEYAHLILSFNLTCNFTATNHLQYAKLQLVRARVQCNRHFGKVCTYACSCDVMWWYVSMHEERERERERKRESLKWTTDRRPSRFVRFL